MGGSADGSVEPESTATSGWLPELGYLEVACRVGGVVWRWHPEPFVSWRTCRRKKPNIKDQRSLNSGHTGASWYGDKESPA